MASERITNCTIRRVAAGATVALLCAAAGLSCAKKQRNALLDPRAGDYVPPLVTVTQDVADSTLTTDTLSLSWTGNSAGSEFSWSVDNGPWSPWGAEASLLTLLDDGSHTLVIRTRYLNGSDVASSTTSFSVAALPDTAVYIVPRLQAPAGDSVVFKVFAKGLRACDVAHLQFSGVRLRTTSSAAAAGSSALVSDSVCDVYALSSGGSCIAAIGEIATIVATADTTRDTVTVGLVACELKTSVSDTAITSLTVANRRGGLLVKGR